MKTPEYKEFKANGRFEICLSDNGDGWSLIDNVDKSLLDFPTKAEAIEAAKLARAYVRKYGDIDFESFPYSLSDPLSYCYQEKKGERPWNQ